MCDADQLLSSNAQKHTPFLFKVGKGNILFHSIRYCIPSVWDSAYKTALQQVVKTKHTKSYVLIYLI